MSVARETESVSSVATYLQKNLPASHGQYADAYAIAALEYRPLGVSAVDFALLHAGLIDRESQAGATLAPRGPEGTGDHSSRWKEEVQGWMNDLQLLTGNEGWSDELPGIPSWLANRRVYVFEVRPPAWAGATAPGWGYGLGQIDFESWAEWLDANDWKNPYVNIRKSAEILSKNCEELGTLRYGIAAYNAGVARIRGVPSGKDPDTRTTGGNYSKDVIARAVNFGFPQALIA